MSTNSQERMFTQLEITIVGSYTHDNVLEKIAVHCVRVKTFNHPVVKLCQMTSTTTPDETETLHPSSETWAALWPAPWAAASLTLPEGPRCDSEMWQRISQRWTFQRDDMVLTARRTNLHKWCGFYKALAIHWRQFLVTTGAPRSPVWKRNVFGHPKKWIFSNIMKYLWKSLVFQKNIEAANCIRHNEMQIHSVFHDQKVE